MTEAGPTQRGPIQMSRAAVPVLAPPTAVSVTDRRAPSTGSGARSIGGAALLDRASDRQAGVEGPGAVGTHAGGGLPTATADADGSTPAYVARHLARAEIVVLPNRSRRYLALKRALDLSLGSALFVLTLPLVAVIALVIRLDSPGPALFRQERVTRDGHHFRFYKFRTMYVDARARFPELYEYAGGDDFDGTYYKLEDDPRNTRVGAWLRRTTLDELPNLLNVLKGDLSLVGPRPELPELVRRYRPEELTCLLTKAGLTGQAQVSGRSLLTVRERLNHDLQYVAHQSTLLDLRILARTVVIVVLRRGAF
jgi:lipopolysaccharide/colanic/teichoic acid biosynthesis glycosyltransferase